MALTYDALATTTLGSNQTNIIFSSINSSYTDLVLILNGRSTRSAGATDGVMIQFNTDTSSASTNYSWRQIYGDGTSAVSNSFTNQPSCIIGNIPTSNNSTSSFFGASIVHIHNYSNSSIYKTTLSRGSVPSPTLAGYTQAHISLWRNTSAITTITLGINDFSTQFLAGTTATLYGIKAA